MHANPPIVHIVRLPSAPDGNKVGIDDYLRGNNSASLRGLIDKSLVLGAEILGNGNACVNDMNVSHKRISAPRFAAAAKPPSPKNCPFRVLPMLRNRKKPKAHLAPELGCGTWRCDVCRQRKQYVYKSHVREILAEYSEIYAVEAADSAESKKVINSLTRKKKDGAPAEGNQDGRYFKFTPIDGGQTLFLLHKPSKGSKSLQPREAVALADEWIDRIPRRRGKPISCGKRWKLKPKKVGEYVRETLIAHRDLGLLVKQLHALELSPEVGIIPETGTRYVACELVCSEYERQSLITAMSTNDARLFGAKNPSPLPAQAQHDCTPESEPLPSPEPSAVVGWPIHELAPTAFQERR